MTHRRSAVLVSCALLLSAGCVTEPDPGEPEAETVAAYAKIRCDDPFCGNTANLGVFPFWELDLSMTSFSPVGGFRIKSMTSVLGGQSLRPEVHGFTLIGRRVDKGIVFVPNFKMQIEADTGELYDLTFTVGGNFQYLDVVALPDKPTYNVTYRQVSFVPGVTYPSLPLCTPTPGGYPRKSLVFRGDRYDISSGRVSAIGAAAGTWFNIACEDDAMWKLAVMQLVEAAEVANQHHTTQDLRTAGLRAIRADYCGTGRAYTVLGTLVDWQNAWLSHHPLNYPRVEAIWDHNGAVCLDHQRYIGLRAGCERPSCATLAGAWQGWGSMRTHVPNAP